MAIIQSTAIGNGKKSAGVLTYRRQRGRTIASQRILTNGSKTVKQVAQRTAFALASKAIAIAAPLVDVTFVKSKYGSARNNFFKLNKEALMEGFKDYHQEIHTPYQLYEAIHGKDAFVTFGNGKLQVSYGGGEAFTASGIGVKKDAVSLTMVAVLKNGKVEVLSVNLNDSTFQIASTNFNLTVQGGEGTNMLSPISFSIIGESSTTSENGYYFPIFMVDGEICSLNGFAEISHS